MHCANPHGCGIVTPSDHYKGMSIDMLLRHLKKRDISEPCLMHFRLATHGSIKRANCHPFLDEESGTWFMHNGILNVDPIGDMTDSETAFREIHEETGLRPVFSEGFRETDEYVLREKPGTRKQVVYFLAEFHDEPLVPRPGEITNILLLPYDEAEKCFPHAGTRRVLAAADRFLADP